MVQAPHNPARSRDGRIPRIGTFSVRDGTKSVDVTSYWGGLGSFSRWQHLIGLHDEAAGPPKWCLTSYAAIARERRHRSHQRSGRGARQTSGSRAGTGAL